ncbi:calcium-transporting P-type ATPase, PMR1-type [Candidatus Woesearchaeota archaeon]|nr:calcium-transporting P-type ATPase, PMR1-type [Candidatus Woesearchaeota archaeon]
MTYHDKKEADILKELQSSSKGLTEKEAEERLHKYGFNELKEGKKASPVKMFLQQFNSVVVYILIAALVISIFLDEAVESIVIGGILILNAVFGFIQEYRAEKSIEALKKLSSLKATVIRDGKEKDIDAKFLVPGDILKLETGDKLPADARLLSIVNLEVQEAALTGESLPVKKEMKVLAEKTALADKINMVFSGTVVTNGRGTAIVTGTGMQTEIGKIATMIQEVEPERTHLQKKLDQLGRMLGVIVLIISAIVFLGGVLEGGGILEFFIVAVALAVAAIPEGLPAIVTIGLALGTKRMVERNALVRKLPSVETLGATTVICTDKTGTLTKNEMTVQKIYANGKVINVTGSGYERKGEFLYNNRKFDPAEIEMLLKAGCLNNNSSLTDGNVIGDPTEAALIVSAEKAGLNKEELDRKCPREEEILFTSERKMMTTINKVSGENLAFVKGAPEVVLGLCTTIYENGKVRPLTDSMKKEIVSVNEEFANDALRVLGFAYRSVMSKDRVEKNLTFLGLQGMIDPPRDEVKAAIAKCRKAGIRVIMITGDNAITAKAIGAQIGLEGKSVTGQDLDRLESLNKVIEEVSIYARVNPEHKIKIVDALKKKGHVVAMTGDGVNDAPALKKADIGVAMGITGTDVAKEASAMILTDDNFASIVNAVEEGRGIYDNIGKFVEYLLSSNVGEVLTLFIAIMLKFPLPVTALMILWINLVTDGLPALALSVDPAEPNIMERKPRNPKGSILSKALLIRMSLVGITIAAGTLAVFQMYHPDQGLEYAQTMAFATLMVFQMFNVLNCRSEFQSLFKVGVFKNMKLWWAILASIAMQIIVIQTPFLEVLFHTTPLTGFDWMVVFLVGASVLAVVEVYKVIVKRVWPEMAA